MSITATLPIDEPQAREPRTFNPRWMLWVFGIVLLAGAWGLAIHEVRSAREQALRNAREDVQNYARLFQEHTERSIQSADQAALFLKYQYERSGRQFDLQGYLSTGVILGDIFNLFTIVDENADVAMSSKTFTRMNLADREHIKVHFDQDMGKLFVGKPVLGRVSGKWSMQMTRRINKPDGSFGGVVVVSMDPFYFTSFYNDVKIGDRGVVTLVGEDAVVRARLMGREASTGQILPADGILKTLKSEQRGTTMNLSRIDGVERIMAFRKLPNYPLYVLVGIPVDEVKASTKEYESFVLAFSSFMTLVVLMFILMVQRMIGRLDRSRQRAEAASAAKSQFLANMSHELRTPLNGILGYSELLKDDLRGREQYQFAAAIHASGSHLLHLVNEVLDLARVEEGSLDLQPEQFDLRPFLDSVVQAQHAFADAKALKLSLQADEALPSNMTSDPVRLRQVLNNLLHNAVKFTEAGSVELSVALDRDEVRFTVTDTGPGIPPEHQERIFEKFVQLDGSLVRRHEGSGLGLSISRRLVELLGGRLALESTPGQGSRFSFALPLSTNQGA